MNRAALRDSGAAELLRFAEQLADTSRLLLEHAAADIGLVETKADNSFVTATDRAIEARLRELIEQAYPDHGVFGEEHGQHQPESEIVWVLDPIDGTAPFIAGIPVYGTLIGISRCGRPWIGVLDYPATRDRWVGLSDPAGGFAEHNGRPVRSRRCGELAGALTTCSNPDFFAASEQPVLARVRNSVRYTLYGTSSFGFAMLAGGRTDLAVDSGLKPYDVFAPAAVIHGAGGMMTGWDGAPLDLGTSGRTLAVGDPALHGAALELVGGAGSSAT
jgi:histidinol phosphatase-like enzyme (inositol monophosphatase family)